MTWRTVWYLHSAFLCSCQRVTRLDGESVLKASGYFLRWKNLRRFHLWPQEDPIRTVEQKVAPEVVPTGRPDILTSVTLADFSGCLEKGVILIQTCCSIQQKGCERGASKYWTQQHCGLAFADQSWFEWIESLFFLVVGMLCRYTKHPG